MVSGVAPGGPEKVSSPERIRNVVLVGPAGAGKTMLFERLIAARVPGRQMRGDPRSSQSLNAASVSSGGLAVNLLDTPGNADFVGEVRAGLRAADAVLFVVPATDLIDDATRLLWRECEAIGMARAVAVTKLEHARADFDETVDHCRLTFGDAQPATLPVISDGSVTGEINLLRRTVLDYGSGEPTVRDATPEEAALLEERRNLLMESIIEESEDEDLLERHLSGEEVELSAVADDLRAAIATARFFPIIATHAPTGVGIEALYDLIEQGFPAPVAAPMPAVFTATGGSFGDLSCDPSGPLVAEVVRTTSDPFVGRLSLVRVFSGTLRSEEPLHVSGHLGRFAAHVSGHADHDSDDERVGPLSAPLSDEMRPKPFAIAGDLVLVSKLTAAETSDTLSSKARPALVEPWLLPEPLLPVAVHASSRNEEEKLGSALQRLVAEDVTMRLEHNPETRQVVIWAMGPAHVEKLLGTLRDNWRVSVEVEPVRTSLAGDLPPLDGGPWPPGQAVRRPRPVRGLQAGDRAAGAWRRHRVHRAGGRRGGAAPVHPLGGEGCPYAAGEGSARRLSGGRRTGHAGGRQSPLGGFLRHGVPDRGRAGPAGGSEHLDCRHPRAHRHHRHHRRGRLGRIGAGRSARPAWPGSRDRDRRAGGLYRHPRRGPGARAVPLPDRPALGVPWDWHLYPVVLPLRLHAGGAGPRPGECLTWSGPSQMALSQGRI